MVCLPGEGSGGMILFIQIMVQITFIIARLTSFLPLSPIDNRLLFRQLV